MITTSEPKHYCKDKNFICCKYQELDPLHQYPLELIFMFPKKKETSKQLYSKTVVKFCPFCGLTDLLM
jgi:hypothetical protein